MQISPNHKINHYRPDIDGLRALAILLVLLYHVFPTVVTGGFIGVDVFFVISGFLITGIIVDELNKGTFTFSGFFARRIKRILPVLVCVLAASIVLGWLFLLPKEFKELGKHIAGGAGFVANLTLWSDAGYFDVLPELKPLLHLWSLGVEEQFYLLWPLALVVFWKLMSVWHSRIRIIIFFIGISLFLSFALNVVFVKAKPELVFYLPFTRFWEIFIGAVLCVILVRHTHSHRKLSVLHENLLSLAGFVLIISAVLIVDKNSLFPGWWAVLPTLGAALIIASGGSAWINKKLLANRLAVAIGLISYPLYLWHWLVLSFVYTQIGTQPYHADKIIIISASVVLALLSYKFIETPLRRMKKGQFVVGGLLIASCVLGGIGFAIYKYDGFPSRFTSTVNNQDMPASLQDMLRPDFGGDISKEWREHDCFLAKGEGVDSFGQECMEHAAKPLVFLWGDSHAATLYFGLKSYQEKRPFSIAQYTASACAPIINWDGAINRLCRAINDSAIEKIRDAKPKIVILEAAWYWSEYDWHKVADTIQELKKIGIPRIVLVGPSPNWKERVPHVILSYYRVYRKLPPLHTTFEVDIHDIAKLDTQLEQLAREMQITYVSLYQTLCDQGGCMLSIGDDIRNVSSLDSGHLSVNASKFVINATAAQIFGEGAEK